MPNKQKLQIIGENPSKNGRSCQSASPTAVMGLNDELDFMGRKLHIQTENAGHAGSWIITQVFCNGRVLFTTKSLLPDDHETRDFSKVESLIRAQHFRVIREMESKKAQISGAS